MLRECLLADSDIHQMQAKGVFIFTKEKLPSCPSSSNMFSLSNSNYAHIPLKCGKISL